MSDSKGYVVTAPMINLRVKDAAGTYVKAGFYAGAVLPDDAHPDDVESHVRKGMVAEKGTPEADAASPVGMPVQFDEGGMPKLAAPAKPTPKPPVKATPAKA